MTTTIDARSALYAFAMQGKEHSPDNSEKASEKLNAFHTASLNEAVEALRAKAQKLSAEAETEMRRDLEDQAQVWHDAARKDAQAIERGLSDLRTTYRVVMLHYSPCRETVEGEDLEEIPFYGNSVMGDAIDRMGADLVVHGHSHHGRPTGKTPGGLLVRNVAAPVIREPYVVLELGQ